MRFHCAVAAAVMLVFAGESVWAVEGESGRTAAQTDSRVLYGECSAGYSSFSMENLNTYYIQRYASPLGYFNAILTGGWSLEAEAGTFLTRYLKLGLGYVQIKGTLEDDSLVEYQGYQNDFRYLDVVFQGMSCGITCDALTTRYVKLFLGGYHVLGVGRVHMGFGRRPDNASGDYGDFNFVGQGLGAAVRAGAQFFPVPHLSFGVSGGYRILRTEPMRSTSDGSPWQRPSEDPHSINLDFSGVTVSAKISVEL